MRQKKIVILGSTGSIGVNALKVIDRFADRFKIVGLTAYNNSKLLEKQVRKYKPQYIAVTSKGIGQVKKGIRYPQPRFFDVDTELAGLVEVSKADIVVIAMRGSAALMPFLSAVRSARRVAPANKEALVIAGDLIMREARKHNTEIIPIDSEQSAIFQCLEGRDIKDLKQVYLTASGGALRNVSRSRFDQLSVKQILAHPRWKMGKKITVDSATLMNKGFETIEAVRLFGLNVRDIKVLIHPEAIIHSMVGFRDGSIMAQLGATDMRLPIQYALTYPQCLKTDLQEVDFFKLKRLTFEKPDLKKFPALDLAFYVARKGGSLPCVLNAVDEQAVEAFLNGKLNFSKIIKVVEKVVSRHRVVPRPSLKKLAEMDLWAREEADKLISK